MREVARFVTYRAIRGIGHKSSDTDTPSLLLCEGPEVYALDLALDCKGDLSNISSAVHTLGRRRTRLLDMVAV